MPGECGAGDSETAEVRGNSRASRRFRRRSRRCHRDGKCVSLPAFAVSGNALSSHVIPDPRFPQRFLERRTAASRSVQRKMGAISARAVPLAHPPRTGITIPDAGVIGARNLVKVFYEFDVEAVSAVDIAQENDGELALHVVFGLNELLLIGRRVG